MKIREFFSALTIVLFLGLVIWLVFVLPLKSKIEWCEKEVKEGGYSSTIWCLIVD